MKVTGHITRRRCIGKKLAFADVQVQHVEADAFDDNNKDKKQTENGTRETDSSNLPKFEEIIQVIFHLRGNDEDYGDVPSSTFVWGDDQMPGDNFPEKSTALPYGAFVTLHMCSASMEERHGRKSYLVKRWKLLQNPREAALDSARTNNMGSGTGEGISCSQYLKARGEAYLKFNTQPAQDWDRKTKKKDIANDKLSSKGMEYGHGSNKAKALRAKIFAEWLIKTYGHDNLALDTGVLDVAGGKGKLSIELSLQGKIPCTIVDPLIRKHGDKLDPREAKRMKKAQCPHPTLLSREFNQTTFLKDCEEIVRSSSLLVGLHPDECTEDILDVAMKYGRTVAIVPCCVFSGFFPFRTLPNGKPVRTYEEFLVYLLSKDDRLKSHTLPFEGRNTVIYWNL
jgi:hypothetical protein